MDELEKNIHDMSREEPLAGAGGPLAASELPRGGRKVLLVLTGTAEDRKSFTYATGVAQRIDAGLEIMYFARTKPEDGVMEHYKELLRKSKLSFHLTRVRGCIKTAIMEYTTSMSNIQFVVAESLDALSSECQKEDRSLRGTLKNLRCPLVLVSEMETT